MERDLLIILGLFLLLSLVVSLEAILSDGHFTYRDEWTVLDLGPFKEYFLHVNKQNGETDFDSHKRIPELWLHFFIDYESYDRIKFTLLAFFTLLNSFFVFNRILGDEGMSGRKKTILSAASAITYLINPLNTQLFLSYYPSINYALFPLFFYFLYRGMRKHELRSTLASALIASFMFLMVVHALLYLALSFFVVMLISLRRPDAAIIRNTALFGIVFFSATAFVLLPYIHVALSSGPVEGAHPLTYRMLSIFSSVSKLPSAMLIDYKVFWWPYVDYEYPLGSSFYLISFVFSAILLTHAFFDRNDWSLMALVALLLLFFFTKGNGPPFAEVYEFLNFRLPVLGWLMRVPMKFAHIIPFFFSILFLRFSLSLMRKGRTVSYAVPAAYLVFLCLFSWPFFTGDMAGYLSKKDLTDMATDLQETNKLIGDGNHSAFLIHEISRLRLVDVDSYALYPSLFMLRELRDYDRFGDWSGLRVSGPLGIRYLMASNDHDDELSGYFEMARGGRNNSLFILDDDASVVQILEGSHLCYGNRDTARSIIRDPPQTGLPEMLLFPYSSFGFPEEHIDASDYIVLTSSQPVFLSVDSDGALPFSSETFEADSSEGWARAFLNMDSVGKRESRLEQHFDFGKGFAAISTKPVFDDFLSSEDILGLEGLQFEAQDSLTVREAAHSFTVPPRSAPKRSMVAAGLDAGTERGGDYELSISLNGTSLRESRMELVFLDHEGNLVSKLPVLERNGSFSADEDVTFSLPSNVTRVFLAFSYLTPQENMSAFEVASFNLSRVFYEKHGEMLNSSFYIGDEGDYDVHVRVLKSQSAGEMRLYLDGDPMSRVMTKGDVNTFHWERVYSGPLSEGEHVVSVEQLGGSNVVNIGYVERSGGQRPDLSGKTIIYRLTGKNDFFGDSFQVVGNKGSSTFHCAMTEGPLLSNIEVFEDGNYDLSYSLEGEATVFVDGQEAGGQVYLEKGLRKIEVRPSGSAICLDHVTLIRGLPPREQEARLLDFRRLDPSTYSVLVNSSTPFLFSFSRAYDPLWVASVGGDSYSPVSSYGVINAFRVNRTGVNEIIVEYAPQKSFYAGIIIGIIGISSAIAYVRRSEP